MYKDVRALLKKRTKYQRNKSSPAYLLVDFDLIFLWPFPEEFFDRSPLSPRENTRKRPRVDTSIAAVRDVVARIWDPGEVKLRAA